MAEFRWILLGLGLVLIAGIWWWGSRRSAQAPGNAELRESTAKEPPRQDFKIADLGAPLDSHEWQMSPFEPLSIKTADFDEIPVLDEPVALAEVETRPEEPEFLDDADTIPNLETGPVMPPLLTNVVPDGAAPLRATPLQPAPSPDDSGQISTAAARSASGGERQKIVSVRVSAPAEVRWSGTELLAAFESHGLAHGRYQVFHRRHVDGRSLFCVASLVEPGTFDMAHMAAQDFKGVTLFAVLPGPVDPLLTIDEMLSAARGLAQELPGIVQDAKGAALSPAGLTELRDDVARFQAMLPDL